MRRFQPLKGVRVLSFEAEFSLPSATRTLAELGAEVVQVGRPDRPNHYLGWVDGIYFEKNLVSIDLKNDAGLALARKLAASADVVSNNFRPAVMKRYELDYESLRVLRPDVIGVQVSGYGAPGPWQDYPGFGPGVEAAGGLWYMTGDASDPPTPAGSGIFTDQLAGRYVAFAVVAALEQRQRTGAGQFIDLSMYEAVVHLLGDAMLEVAATGAAPARTGNRSATAAPQGVYSCRGADEWVAITVSTAAQWQALAGITGDDRFQDSALQSLTARHERHDEIDTWIAEWTRAHDKNEAAQLLQSRGIAAGPVQRTSELLSDPQYAERGTFQMARHHKPILGYVGHLSMTLALSVEGRQRAKPAASPGPGADNAKILKRWLGLNAAQVRQLQQNGALLPPKDFTVEEAGRLLGRPEQRDREFAGKLGLPIPSAAED